MRPHRAAALGVTLILAAAACGGGEDEQADTQDDTATTVESPTPTTAEDAEAAPTTEAEPAPTTEAPTTVAPTTEAPTTTQPPATTTTVPAIGELTVEPVVDVTGRAISHPHSADGTTIIGLAESPGADGGFTSSLVRIDTTGAVLGETPAGENGSVFDVAETAGGRRFVYLNDYSSTTYDASCQLREIDGAALTLGWPLVLPFENSCGGGVRPDPDVTDALWIGPLEDELVNVNVATGAMVPMAVGAAAPAGYDVWGFELLGGNVYLYAKGAYDDVTGEQTTAPDGTPLPTLVTRFDGATGAAGTPTAVPDGRFVVIDGRLVVLGEETNHELDPMTLAATDLGDEDVKLQPRLIDGGDVAWTVGYSETGIEVAHRDPETGRATAIGTLEREESTTSFVQYDGVVVGGELLILVSTTDYTARSATTAIFRARPA